MRIVLLVNIFLFCFQSIFGQSISKPQLEYSRHANLNRVTRFVIENKQFLWGITAAGDVVRWDIQNEKALPHPLQKLNRKATAILLDRQRNLVLGFNDGSISVFETERQTLIPLPARGKGEIQFLFADSMNDYWAVTPQGVFNPMGRAVYSPNNSSFAYNNEWPDLSWEPQCACLDDNDRLWIGFNKGEFGGDLYCFDISKKIFMDYSFPFHDKDDGNTTGPSLQSIFCTDQGDVFMTTGRYHFLPGDGRLYRFKEGEGEVVFDWSAQPKKLVNGWELEEYIGPGSYNSQTKKVYYYSDRGFFRQKGTGPVITGWDFLIKPDVNWGAGKYQTGAAMNVMQFDFIDGEDFIFTTFSDGLGIYRKGKIRFLRQQCSQSDMIKQLLPGTNLMMVVGSDLWEEQFNLYQNGRIKPFSLSEDLNQRYAEMRGIVIMPDDRIIAILKKTRRQNTYGQAGETGSNEYHAVVYDGKSFVRLKKLPFPAYVECASQRIISDKISADRFLIQSTDMVMEYFQGKYRTVYSGAVKWVRYNNDGSILIAPKALPAEDVEAKIVCIQGKEEIELNLTPINETRESIERILDSSHVRLNEEQWQRLQDISKLKLVWYQGKPLTVSGAEVYSYLNGSWSQRKDIEEWLDYKDVAFFDYFPELDMFLFQNDASIFVHTQGKTFDLGKSLDLVCDITTARLWNSRIFLGTAGRGLVEFDSKELLKLIAKDSVQAIPIVNE
jgi:hypothetical protein